MTTPAPTEIPDDTQRFPSLEAMRVAHSELLKRQREQGTTPEFLAEAEAFILGGRAAGALLDADDERWDAQSMLDYWGTRLYRPGYEPPDATLADFDPELAPELPDALCPYVGLDAFREANQKTFFGRERFIGELVDKLKAERLLAVLGPSGSGKSSVVRAGLIPTLEGGVLPGSEDWFYFPTIVPGSNPLLNLARLTQPANATLSTDGYRQKHNHLAQIVAERLSGTVVLVVDQFEEVFTLGTDDGMRQAFVDNLVELASVPEAEHRVILTMRTDFESQIARLPDFQPLFERAAMRVTPLGVKELREAIETPAKLIGLKFEEGVVEALLQDILGEAAALPLLQFTLLKLWERRDRNRVTWEAYKKLGGGRQALARAADELYDNLIPEEQVTAKRILLKLVRPGEGKEVTSSRIRKSALYHKSEASDRIDRVLGKVIRARLLRTSEGESEADTQVEVAHEALVRNWPRLVSWLEDERVALRQRQRLTTAAEQWQRLGKDPSALWRGVLLEEAMSYDDLSELEAQFVAASQAAVEAEEEAKRQAEQQAIRAEMAEKVAAVERERAEEQARAAVRLRRGLITSIAALVAAIVMALIALSSFFSARASAIEADRQRATAQVASTEAIAQKNIAQAASIEAVAAKEVAVNNEKRAIAAESASRARVLAFHGLDESAKNPLLGLRLVFEGLMLVPPADTVTRDQIGEAARNQMAQGRVLYLGSDVEAIYPNPDNTLFILDRENGPGELCRTVDGTCVKLTSSHESANAAFVDHAVFSPDSTGIYFVVIYDDTTGELRRTADSTVIAALDPNIEEMVFSSDPQASYLKVLYRMDPSSAPTLKLYRTADGSQITPDKVITDVGFNAHPDAGYFTVMYDDESAEVRRISDTTVAFQPSKRVTQLTLSPDPNAAYFAVVYRDGSAELRRTADPNGAAVWGRLINIRTISFSDPNVRYFMVSYRADKPSELRRISDGVIVFKPEGELTPITYLEFGPGPQTETFIVQYASGRTQMRRIVGNTATGLWQTLAPIRQIEFSDPGGRYFVVAFEDQHNELRRVADSTLVKFSSHSKSDYGITFSPDSQATYFVRWLLDERHAELYHSADASPVQLNGPNSPIADISFSDDPQRSFFIIHYEAAPTELYRMADATRVGTLTGRALQVVQPAPAVNFSPDTLYFAVTYDTAQAELWSNTGALLRLAPLGLAAFERYFDAQSQRGIVHYFDGRVYVLDLTLLSALGGDPSQFSLEELRRQVCDLFVRVKFDEAELQPYLGDGPPQACR